MRLILMMQHFLLLLRHQTVEAARGASLLIHEATFEDDFAEDALRKRHSTTSEALDVAAQVGVLTCMRQTIHPSVCPSILFSSPTHPPTQSHPNPPTHPIPAKAIQATFDRHSDGHHGAGCVL
jgi:hypothetical protein